MLYDYGSNHANVGVLTDHFDQCTLGFYSHAVHGRIINNCKAASHTLTQGVKPPLTHTGPGQGHTPILTITATRLSLTENHALRNINTIIQRKR